MKSSTLTIRKNSDPCLRRKSAPLREVGPAERMLMDAMLVAMYENKGVGLAAPQVGVNQQIFVVDIGDGPIFVANPQIIKKAGSACLDEGCLSLPKTVVNVRRPKTITVRYLDQNNLTVQRECSDLLARVFLHETDHLLGRLIIDYRGLPEKLGLKKKARPGGEEKTI